MLRIKLLVESQHQGPFFPSTGKKCGNSSIQPGQDVGDYEKLLEKVFFFILLSREVEFKNKAEADKRLCIRQQSLPLAATQRIKGSYT